MSVQVLPGLGDSAHRPAWVGERLPVYWDGRRPCLRCSVGEIIRVGTFTQTALFYHGGYGAAERTTVDLCIACGHVNIALLETINPRQLV